MNQNPNSVALFKGVQSAISCPQIFAGRYREGESILIWPLMSESGEG